MHTLKTLAAAACLTVVSTSAYAFGDTCYRDVSARGEVRSSMRGAMDASIAAWERKVASSRGSRFSNWWYSGDRVTSCNWDNSGRRIQCVATALPCGRK